MNLERALGRLGDILPEAALSTFAGAGHAGVPCVAPDSVEQASEVLQLAAAERWKVLPLGRGTKLGWARAPRELDLVLSSTRLTGILAYEPADGTLTARAGTPWSELVAAVAGRHHLSPELPPDGAGTFGGVLAAGASGLDRLRYGPLRHHVLGLGALHADGSFVKSGGRVVKNVTGYDLHRLWCGSHGTLCFLVEGTLRLQTAPASVLVARRTLPTLEEGVHAAHALLRAHLQPLAVVLAERAGAAPELAVVLAGRAEAVADELTRTRALLGEVELLEGEAAQRERTRLSTLERHDDGWAPLTLGARPSRLLGLLTTLRQALAAQDLAVPLVVQPLLARVVVPLGEVVREQRLELERALAGHELAWQHHPGDFRPPLRTPPAALELMRRIKRSVDPRGLFAPGRFHDDV